MNSEQKLIDFHIHSGVDHKNRTIHDIWALDHFWLEHCHDYIQWLFPIDQSSRFNKFAPTLNPESLETLRTSSKALENQRRSLVIMLNFFGLKLKNNQVFAQENLSIRTHIWLKHGGHNQLRITRIIRSLNLLGQTELAKVIQDGFINIGVEHGEIKETTIEFWRNATKNP